MPSLPVIPSSSPGASPASVGGPQRASATRGDRADAAPAVLPGRFVCDAAAVDGWRALPATSLYIHTPFCVHKCHYCDFYSFVDKDDQQHAFADRLIEELTCLAPHAGPIHTIFVGGGTPSLLRVELWERILAALHRLFDLAAIRAGPGEFTVECNPESTTPELLGCLVAGGVDRVSLGAQSFNPRQLQVLERRHDPANVARALELAAQAGVRRRSIDLIFAVPGQSLADWAADLHAAIALGTTHLSCYNLTYEPNTAMTARLKRGEFQPADEDLETDMFALTLATLRAAGLERYEVSNFAAPGQACRHNLAYWRQDSWLAAGPSAAGHVLATGPAGQLGGWRYKNAPHLPSYLASRGFAPMIDVEAPDAARLVRERLMTGLRLAEGLDADRLCTDADAAVPGAGARLRAVADRLRRAGHLHGHARRWTLTDDGFLLADALAAEMMAQVMPEARP